VIILNACLPHLFLSGIQDVTAAKQSLCLDPEMDKYTQRTSIKICEKHFMSAQQVRGSLYFLRGGMQQKNLLV
jgi:hypothetical protein